MRLLWEFFRSPETNDRLNARLGIVLIQEVTEPMSWGTDLFRTLHDNIQDANLQAGTEYAVALLPSIEETFNSVVDDLKSLSKAPTKSESNRKTLEGGISFFYCKHWAFG